MIQILLHLFGIFLKTASLKYHVKESYAKSFKDAVIHLYGTKATGSPLTALLQKMLPGSVDFGSASVVEFYFAALGFLNLTTAGLFPNLSIAVSDWYYGTTEGRAISLAVIGSITGIEVPAGASSTEAATILSANGFTGLDWSAALWSTLWAPTVVVTPNWITASAGFAPYADATTWPEAIKLFGFNIFNAFFGGVPMLVHGYFQVLNSGELSVNNAIFFTRVTEAAAASPEAVAGPQAGEVVEAPVAEPASGMSWMSWLLVLLFIAALVAGAVWYFF